MAEKVSVYEIITNKIVAMLEEGTVPWQQPWVGGVSHRSIHGHVYRGINAFLLNIEAASKGYSSPFWITYKQAAERGGNVRKGEQSTIVTFWKMLKVKDEEDPKKTKTIPMLRYYRVFNLDQVDGVKAPALPIIQNNGRSLIEKAESIIAGYTNPPKLVESVSSDGAWYSPGKDLISVPSRSLFPSLEQFYGTVFHEMGHSTGHESRLNRPKGSKFGSHEYGREELVAEMTAAFLNAEAGIDAMTHEENAAYLRSWVSTIKEDVKAVVVAAGQAQKAADLILGNTTNNEDGNEDSR